MHRSGSWPRLLAGALAVWFGLVTAAPAVLHGCPRALAAAASAEGSQTEAHHHHGSPAQQGQSSQLPTECTCLGTCATATVAVLPTALTLPAPRLVLHAGGAISAPADLAPAATPDHARPFATAPPLRIA